MEDVIGTCLVGFNNVGLALWMEHSCTSSGIRPEHSGTGLSPRIPVPSSFLFRYGADQMLICLECRAWTICFAKGWGMLDSSAECSVAQELEGAV